MNIHTVVVIWEWVLALRGFIGFLVRMFAMRSFNLKCLEMACCCDLEQFQYNAIEMKWDWICQIWGSLNLSWYYILWSDRNMAVQLCVACIPERIPVGLALLACPLLGEGYRGLGSVLLRHSERDKWRKRETSTQISDLSETTNSTPLSLVSSATLHFSAE